MAPFVPRKRRRSSSPSPQATAITQGGRKPTIFDTLDAKPKGRTVEGNKAFLDSLNTESSGSDSCGSDVGVPNAGLSSRRRIQEAEEDGEGDDDEVDWEDAVGGVTSVTHGGEPSGDLELILEKNSRLPLDAGNKKKGPSKIQRHMRIQTHSMHVQSLLYHNFIRNIWIGDGEVQNILVSQLTPGVRKEWERWQAASGIDGAPGEGARERLETAQPGKDGGQEGKGKGKGKGRAGKQREWGGEAAKVDVGPPDPKGPDPLIRFLGVLVGFWKKRFRICAPGLRKKGYKSPSTLESEISSFRNDPHDPKVHGERVRNIEEFRELARKCEGSRDVGAQLFTALLKGLGLETRLVASLQPVGFGWSKVEDAAVTRRERSGDIRAGNGGWGEAGEDSGNEGAYGKSEDQTASGKAGRKARGSTKLSAKRTRKRGGGRDMLTEGSDNSSGQSDEDNSDNSLVKNANPSIAAYAPNTIDKDLAFPTYWSEVFSPTTNRYIPVDALVLKIIAASPDALASFEPRGAKAEKAKQVISYVISYSSDGTAKDVTVRYLKRHVWPGKTKGFRMPVEKVPVYDSRGRVKRHGEFDWFKGIMRLYERPANKRTWIDDLEEIELRPANPTREVKARGETLQSYKNSTEFVLERHLRRDEAIIPGRKHVKTFTTGKGEKTKEEKVYRRSDVVSCKTSESWHKEGREIKEGEQPLKLVPMRAVTLTRKREIELAEAEAGGRVMQGLYSHGQTRWIIPPPIVDGVIPKNVFGNIDCFVPSMVPKGAVHVPLRGTAKVARKLGIDYAEAVIGFEFGAQRAVPVIDGVVVATENEQVLIDAWHEAEQERKRKEDGKREKIALGTWRKFLMGLRIIERVREEYGGVPDGQLIDEVNPFVNENKRKKSLKGHTGHEDNTPVENAAGTDQEGELPGGFLPEEANDEDGEGSELVSSNRDELHDGGGFIVEDDGEKPARNTESMASGASKRAPISLFSLHQSTARNVQDSDDDDNDDDEDESDGDQSPDHNDSRTGGGGSSPGPGPENTAVFPHRTKRDTPRRRAAARRSETAVRSYYFEHSSEGSRGGGGGGDSASPRPADESAGMPAAKRRKKSGSGAVSRAREKTG
ncbi:hypothetical protein GP486_006180 [Trichoglossum hirsutum]|uniref:Rad4-domain-containing protein n=1 Tax=Trichoglossum hirsutum TaxID=265104 RepID=A0A9P8L3X9_9PEZI|nr:hypothetical protein GP486_006180 [Trichoglossum hirsutum]